MPAYFGDKEFVKKVKKFYTLTDKERIEKVNELAKERLTKFTKPDPRKEISKLILKTHGK